MNWAKRLTAGDCPRCGGRLEDLGDGQVSCDTCEYPEGSENPEGEAEDENICAQCGEEIGAGEAHDCPICGARLCSAACLKSHAFGEHDCGVCDQCDKLFHYDDLVDVGVGDDERRGFCSKDCAKQWLEENR